MDLRAYYKFVDQSGSVILSVSHPTDSRGETVYETQGATQKDAPIVAGVYIQPSATKLPKPKYPKSKKKERATGDVTVEGVISLNGEFIDAKIVESTDSDFSQSALDAVALYRFKPASLDGRPVAILTRVVVSFRVF